MKQKKAFTLIELLIVVAIIAILAAIAVPNFLEAQTRAKVSRVKSDMRSLATAIEAYTVDNNRPVREYLVAVDGPFFGQNNAGGILSPRLSTPVAYITNAFILDIFVDKAESLPPDERYFSYANVIERGIRISAGQTGWFFGGPLTQPQRQEEVLNNYGAWYLLSVGPDKSFWNNPGVSGRGGITGREYIQYDPTNGTTSIGNIIRSQKHSDQFQPKDENRILGVH